jgi:hypothetical protein
MIYDDKIEGLDGMSPNAQNELLALAFPVQLSSRVSVVAHSTCSPKRFM